ncbi:MAG TPA: hypothetical protein ENK57_05640 [Polyangiaceae bacterium]|nr:hypothetical protein [Polyangiaceae bacterium]
MTADQIEQALYRYRDEPSAQELVRAALSERSATPGRLRDAMDRARATGWLPTARGAIRRGQAVDLRGLTGTETPANVSTGDDLMLEARLVFRFDRIVFAPQEPALLRELRAAEASEQALSELVVRLYFERRRLQLERDLAGHLDVVRALRILELETLLDVLSGGRLTRGEGGMR